MKQLLLFILLLSPFFSYPQTNPYYSVFLIGDAGEPLPDGKDPVLNTLQMQLQKVGKNSAVIFMGDNIYPKGLAEAENPDRAQAEARLAAQLKVVQNYEGSPFVIPGNHDWQKGGKDGWAYVKNQEAFVAGFLNRDDVFYPKGGCSTPQEILLNDSLTLVLYDSQWFLHPWDKPGETSDCEVKTLESMLTAIDDILYRNRHKKVIVSGHHPMYSHGHHGGYYTWKDHILPMHDLGINIPFPVIGSLYPLYRSYIGNIQDIPNAQYKLMRDGLVNIMKQYSNVVYANGHEHSLQLIYRDSINYITSGSGSQYTPVKYGNDTKFARAAQGFARLDFYSNGETRLVFFEGDGQEGKELYNEVLPFVKKYNSNPVSETEYKDTKTKIPTKRYKAGPVKRFLLGNNYRDVWTRPIEVKKLDLKNEYGGLKVIQRGGGLQTLSLRYQAKNGDKYVTRSIEKYPSSAVPDAIKSEFTVDVLDDQISAAHPFAALAVPPLAEAAGILHTNPRLVVIPEDTILGNYKRLFSNQLALFEERPDDGFAGAKKTYSTLKVVDKLADNNNNSVDQKEVLRARLFDMLIGDWDRHDDQWRWAAYENGKGLVFKPIPRDRDQAFFVNQGLLPKIASRKWIMSKIQGFDYKIRDVASFNFNARYFDRSFLTGMEEKDWLNMANELKGRISDELIDSAVARLPQPDIHAEIIAKKLKKRRGDLPEYAREQYKFLGKEVDVLGSDKDEIIEINRRTDGQTEVVVFDQKKNGDKGRLLYERIFDPSVTKEIRVWGLDGEDKFLVNGQTKHGIKLRLIGGKGKDEFTDSSKVRGWGKKTLIYDKTKNTTLNLGGESRNLTTDKHPDINTYSRDAFVYNRLAPLMELAYNPDNGLFVGSGIQWTKQGFRKSPFSMQHSVSGNYAFSTRAFNLYYKGTFVDVIGKTDVDVKVTLQQEGITYNFFGLGNETKYIEEKGIRYYRTIFSNYDNSLMFKHNAGKAIVFYYGPVYNGIKVKENPTRFINEYAPAGSDVYKEKDFLGVRAGFTIDTRDSKIQTTRGVYWDLNATYLRGLNVVTKDDYSNMKTDLALYWTLKLPATITIATRFGGGVNFTDFEFFQANYLSGLTNLRGFRQNRFAGKGAFYNNTEIRLKVFSFRSYLFPAAIGLLAFNDVGRVWYQGESSDKWHFGYGGGVWISPFKIVTASIMCGFSDEGAYPLAKLGFFF